ncbi:MAG: ATPase [Desulfobacterales bacterium SG8_35_2]|jgi:V/A-type H+-transporting ATPase subunit D|nr:MAG: ATPase [Desulfobacterales bacterium SG8_35_2]
MMHPTRTNLLLLKEKSYSVSNSIGILKSRRQALIIEFLKTSTPYLESRKTIRQLYGEGIVELFFSLGHTGESVIDSISEVATREFGVEITSRKLWGLEYKEIYPRDSAVRNLHARNYDTRSTTANLEEAIWRFEKIVDAILDIAAYDNKLQRLSREIIQTTRRVRVLEERMLPKLKGQIKSITQYLGERERETYFRLKQFKEIKHTAK